MSYFKGKKVLITGGASEIGRIMGRALLEKGAEVIICDLDPVKLEETLAMFPVLGKTSGYRLDLPEEEQVSVVAAQVKKESGPVDILINNAGIVLGKYFHEHTTGEINQTMGSMLMPQCWWRSNFFPKC